MFHVSRAQVHDDKLVWVSVVVAVGMGVLTTVLIMPFLYKAVHAQSDEHNR